MSNRPLQLRTKPCLTGRLARLGRGLVLAISLGPTVAAAQGTGTVTIPSPLIDPGSTTPRVIEGSAPSSIPMPRVIVPPTFPTVIPIENPAVQGGTEMIGAGGARGRIIQLVPDTTGLVPDLPPGPIARRPVDEVAKKVGDLIEVIQDPEAELSVAVGHTKLIETRRPLTRIAIANPGVADLELLSDQPNSRFMNLYGRAFGTTNITFWDEQNQPLSFRVRVTLDTRDLESRIKQSFPGAQIHIRQVGPQVILEGQVTDNKTMADVLSLVTAELRNSGGIRFMQGGGGGGMGGGGMGGGGMGGGGMGGGAGGGGMGGGGMGGGGMGGGGMGGGGMGGGMGGGGGEQSGLVHHQSRPYTGTTAGAAPGQDRRAQSNRDPNSGRELAEPTEQFDPGLDDRRRGEHPGVRGDHAGLEGAPGGRLAGRLDVQLGRGRNQQQRDPVRDLQRRAVLALHRSPTVECAGQDPGRAGPDDA